MESSILLKIGLWILRKLFGGNADAAVQVDAAVTKAQATNVEKENAVLKEAAADRAAGDAGRLRADPSAGEVHADRNDAINRNPDLNLRD